MKVHNVQAMRAFAALLVVSSHLSTVEERYLPNSHLMAPFHLLGYSGVDAFFIVSGFVMAVTTWTQFQQPGAPQNFLLRRVARIYPAYWIVSAAILPVWLLAPSLVNSHADYPTSLIASFALLPQRGPQLLLVGWTLVHEMYFYLVFSLMLLFSRRYLALLIALWAIAIAVTHTLLAPTPANPYAFVLTNPINLEFCLGIGVGALVATGKLHLPWLWTALGATGIATSYAIMAHGTDLTGEWTRDISLGLPYALLIYGLIGLEVTHHIAAPHWLSKMGDASYAIYLLHVPVLAIYGRALAALHPQPPVANIIAIASCYAIVITAATLFYRHIETPTLRTLNQALHLHHPNPKLEPANPT